MNAVIVGELHQTIILGNISGDAGVHNWRLSAQSRWRSAVKVLERSDGRAFSMKPMRVLSGLIRSRLKLLLFFTLLSVSPWQPLQTFIGAFGDRNVVVAGRDGFAVPPTVFHVYS